MRDRRLKCFYVDDIEVYRVFSQNDGVYRKFELEDLPSDAEIVNVHFDHPRIAFVFIVYHESFEEVPLGNKIPDAGSLQVTVKVLRED